MKSNLIWRFLISSLRHPGIIGYLRLTVPNHRLFWLFSLHKAPCVEPFLVHEFWNSFPKSFRAIWLKKHSCEWMCRCDKDLICVLCLLELSTAPALMKNKLDLMNLRIIYWFSTTAIHVPLLFHQTTSMYLHSAFIKWNFTLWIIYFRPGAQGSGKRIKLKARKKSIPVTSWSFFTAWVENRLQNMDSRQCRELFFGMWKCVCLFIYKFQRSRLITIVWKRESLAGWLNFK